jgi:hypothetical protein
MFWLGDFFRCVRNNAILTTQTLIGLCDSNSKVNGHTLGLGSQRLIAVFFDLLSQSVDFRGPCFVIEIHALTVLVDVIDRSLKFKDM